MKLFTIATTILPLATAAFDEKQSSGLPKVNAVIDVNGLDLLDVDAGPLNALSILRNLLDRGEIAIVDADDQNLSKRAKVPLLKCGYSRATRCALSGSNPVTTCVWALIAGGTDMKENTKCVAGAMSHGANLPHDCVGDCLEH